MTVKELIRRLVEFPMDAEVIVEIPTQKDYKYSSSDLIDCELTEGGKCLIYEY